MAAESSERPTATSLSCSYGIVCRKERVYILVNAGFGDPVGALIDMHTTRNNTEVVCKIQDYYQGIETVLYGDGPRYTTTQLIFTVADNGAVVTARYLLFNTSGELVSLADVEHNAKRAMRMARYLLWCDYVRNNVPNAIKDAVEASKLGRKRKLLEDEEICVICLKEYIAEDMIGTLRCKHSYHDVCIKKWLTKTIKKDCPMCRTLALYPKER